MRRHDDKSCQHGTRAGVVDIDRLEALLIEAARARRSLTYAEVLAHFGIRITPRRVYALCRDLGAVCERNRARGEPELAVLVVRKSDRLPGEGFFHSLWRDGAYDGPATGPAAEAFIRREAEGVFAHWAPPPA
ncbi:MAG: ribose-phosphate pyrophosphokinase [Geminicoccaceae bacterium]